LAAAAAALRNMATAPAPAPVDLPQLPPFEHTPAPYDGPPKEEVLALRKRFLSPGASAAPAARWWGAVSRPGAVEEAFLPSL